MPLVSLYSSFWCGLLFNHLSNRAPSAPRASTRPSARAVASKLSTSAWPRLVCLFVCLFVCVCVWPRLHVSSASLWVALLLVFSVVFAVEVCQLQRLLWFAWARVVEVHEMRAAGCTPRNVDADRVCLRGAYGL